MNVGSLKNENNIFKVGSIHTLKLAVTWPGFKTLLDKGPKVKFPKGLKSRGVTSTTVLRDGQSVLEYHYRFELKEEVSDRASELSYRPKKGGARGSQGIEDFSECYRFMGKSRMAGVSFCCFVFCLFRYYFYFWCKKEEGRV